MKTKKELLELGFEPDLGSETFYRKDIISYYKCDNPVCGNFLELNMQIIPHDLRTEEKKFSIYGDTEDGRFYDNSFCSVDCLVKCANNDEILRPIGVKEIKNEQKI